MVVKLATWAASLMEWLAAQPPLNGFLAHVAASPLVQAVEQALIGERPLSPGALLAAITTVFAVSVTAAGYIAKVRLLLWGTYYFCVSRDKKTKKPNDKKVDFTSSQLKRKKVIFIRHGESEWNLVFNKGFGPSFPVRLVRALLREVGMFFQPDSVFVDSPLSKVGLQQAWDLLTFLTSQPEGCTQPGAHLKPVKELEVNDIVSIIRGDVGQSVVACSILRRCISTGFVGLSTRLLRAPPDEKLHLMTCLQEISRNVDTLSVTPAGKRPQPPQREVALENVGDILPHFYETRLDSMLNHGNKTVQTKAEHRQERFVRWVFERKEETIIVSGHSLYFREFFKSYLPKNVQTGIANDAKTKKIQNCGAIAFDFYQIDPQNHRVDNSSIKEIYLGFEDKKKKKK